MQYDCCSQFSKLDRVQNLSCAKLELTMAEGGLSDFSTPFTRCSNGGGLKKLLTLTVQFTVLVIQKMCHQLCVLLCSRAGATSALIELRRIQRWYALMQSATQYDWKCRLCVKTPKWLDRQR